VSKDNPHLTEEDFRQSESEILASLHQAERLAISITKLGFLMLPLREESFVPLLLMLPLYEIL